MHRRVWEQPLPEERLQQVRSGAEPPGDTVVWIVPSVGTVQPAEYEIKGLDIRTARAPEGTHGELFTLCIGRLAVQVFSMVLDDVERTISVSQEM